MVACKYVLFSWRSNSLGDMEEQVGNL